MATEDSTTYEPSDDLRSRLAGWEKSVQGEKDARADLEKGIAAELTTDLQLTNHVLAEHLPWTPETVRLIAVAHQVPRRERRRKTEGGPVVYRPSEQLLNLLGAWNSAVDLEKQDRDKLEQAIADDLIANPTLSNAEMAEHLPWGEEQVRIIARARNVPRRSKRGTDHKVVTTGSTVKVLVPIDWYKRQKGTDPDIVSKY
ncbi:hypothetical protein [Streptomyces sp. NPDC086782]|uniref:hypothetical protein n=1 Tax=Streptomyces sp. NPDC086782 TaxID=3365757 RepID=UPI0037FAC9C5